MRASLLLSVCSCASWFQGAFGFFPKIARVQPLELSPGELENLASADTHLTGKGTFETYIDHNNPDLGKFKLQYWYNATLWKGPGSPVFLFTPGEVAAAEYGGYLTNRALTGLYAQEVGGAILIVEHRYYGESSPYEKQSTKNLQYLNLDQSVADFVLLARTMELPFDKSGKTNAPKAPWVWVGGSYPGSLASWIEKTSPGTFWAYHGSSAPVQAVYDYWQYFYPIQDGMPKNCSKDFESIIDHVDNILLSGSVKDKVAVRELFGLAALEHDDDVGQAVSSPMWDWQGIQFYSGYSRFYQMCDAIEGVTANSTGPYGPGGVGLEKALQNYAVWFKKQYLPGFCKSYDYSDWSDENNVQCFDTYNSSMQVWNDWSSYNTFNRPWIWQTCNDPFFYYQTGAPKDVPTVFSRLVTPEYWQRQCELFFPREGSFTYSSNQGKTAENVNAHTGGWLNTNAPRLLTSNGEFDPWRSGSVSSVFRPGGPFTGTPETPVILIEGSRHCNDLLMPNSVHPPVAAAQAAEIKQISAWVKDFYDGQKTRRVTRGSLGLTQRAE